MQGIDTLRRLSLDLAKDLRDLADTDDRVEAAQNASPEDAERALEREYEPLLGGNRSQRDNGDDSKPSKLGDASATVRRWETIVAYSCFLILGAAILLPWHAIIVATPYFGVRLLGSKFQDSAASFTTLAFTLSNVVFLARATITHTHSASNWRIAASIITIIGVLVLFCVSTRIAEIPPGLVFGGLIALTVLASAAASYLQNSVVALSALFGAQYLQGILAGQGAIGAAVAATQLVTAAASKPESAVSTFAERKKEAQQVRDSAFAFFAVAAAFAGATLLAQFILLRMPFYRLRVRAAEGEDEQDDKDHEERKKPTVWSVEPKVRSVGLAVFYVFFVTISVFPAITSSIASVHDPPGTPRIFADALFIPLGFLVFATGDWIGRAMPQHEIFRIKRPLWLIIASVLRTAFIVRIRCVCGLHAQPLFLLCNVATAPTSSPPVINSDVAYLLILSAFAISNGYFSTLLMMACVQVPGLKHDEVDVASTVGSFYLTAGLASGALASFAVRGIVCQCSPF